MNKFTSNIFNIEIIASFNYMLFLIGCVSIRLLLTTLKIFFIMKNYLFKINISTIISHCQTPENIEILMFSYIHFWIDTINFHTANPSIHANIQTYNPHSTMNIFHYIPKRHPALSRGLWLYVKQFKSPTNRDYTTLACTICTDQHYRLRKFTSRTTWAHITFER